MEFILANVVKVAIILREILNTREVKKNLWWWHWQKSPATCTQYNYYTVIDECTYNHMYWCEVSMLKVKITIIISAMYLQYYNMGYNLPIHGTCIFYRIAAGTATGLHQKENKTIHTCTMYLLNHQLHVHITYNRCVSTIVFEAYIHCRYIVPSLYTSFIKDNISCPKLYFLNLLFSFSSKFCMTETWIHGCIYMYFVSKSRYIQTVLYILDFSKSLLLSCKCKPASSSLIMSSLRLVPPVVTMIRAFIYLLSSLHSWEVCRASSLVGTTTNAAMQVWDSTY